VTVRAWFQAARPLAIVNIAVPLLVGQGLAFSTARSLSWTLLGLVLVAGVFDQLFIVFANDVADEQGDRAHQAPTPFSGGSRVLVEGKLTPAQLRNGARIAAVLLGVVAGVTGYAFDRPWVVPMWGAGIMLLWAYSFPPLRLSYRGWGEVAQGLGVGVGLPLISYYTQVGNFDAFPWPALAPMFLLGFASNITTALPDRDADLACDKKTWPVRFGLHRARVHSLQITAVAVFMTPFVLPHFPRWVWAAVEAAPALVLLAGLVELKRDETTTRDALVRAVVINGAAATLVMVGWLVAALTVVPLVM
jgi:1,4-dihydroxy-2-naphthoate octaprenyltransferase